MITWGDTIGIILDMFSTVNQKQLAGLLGISVSSLSKIKTGKRKGSFESEAVFNQVFNPDMTSSPAKDTPRYLLNSLKDIIGSPKYEKVYKGMADCWNETDYKTFVITLLNRTRNKVQNSDDSVPACLPQSDSAGISTVGSPSVRLHFLPHSDDCCYHCVYWEGDKETIGAYMTPTYGFCVKYNRDNQKSSTIACEDYKKRKKQNWECGRNCTFT